jgi:hypothetical protein
VERLSLEVKLRLQQLSSTLIEPPSDLFRMAKIPSLLIVLSLIHLISCLPAIDTDTSLEPRIVTNGYSTQIFKITFYGAPDSNSASEDCETAVRRNDGSNTIAHAGCYWNGAHRGLYAGGDGSYANPLTAASKFESNNSPVPQCGVWYSPFLQKWLIYEDECPSCDGQPGQAHFDIWVGGNGGGPGHSYNNIDLCHCLNTLTPGAAKA